jgi:hypothetical protein
VPARFQGGHLIVTPRRPYGFAADSVSFPSNSSASAIAVRRSASVATDMACSCISKIQRCFGPARSRAAHRKSPASIVQQASLRYEQGCV